NPQESGDEQGSTNDKKQPPPAELPPLTAERRQAAAADYGDPADENIKLLVQSGSETFNSLSRLDSDVRQQLRQPVAPKAGAVAVHRPADAAAALLRRLLPPVARGLAPQEGTRGPAAPPQARRAGPAQTGTQAEGREGLQRRGPDPRDEVRRRPERREV